MKTEKKAKKTPWQQHLSQLFLLLIGAVCGFVLVEHINAAVGVDAPVEKVIPLLLVIVAGFYLGLFIHTVIHEAGHLVFGLLSGYRFSSFRIKSFTWIKESGKIKFKLLTLAGTAGQCLMAPPDLVDGKIPVILYNLGGSLMNVIAASVSLVLYFATTWSHLLSGVFLALSICGFALAIMNGVPMRVGLVNNDGHNAIMLRRDPEALRSFWVQLKVNSELAKGVCLLDMPEEWFVFPSDEAMKNSMVAEVGALACERLMDQKKFAEADARLAQLLEFSSTMSGLIRCLKICDRMYIELITENRPAVLNEMLTKEQKKFMKSMRNFPTVIRTEYAYALLRENNREKAEQIQARFEKCAKTYPYPIELQAERQRIELATEKF